MDLNRGRCRTPFSALAQISTSHPIVSSPAIPATPPPAAVSAEPLECELTLQELLASLGPDQKDAVEWAMRGYNMFVTGGAGKI